MRATGILTPHAPLYSDASEPTFTSLPKTLQGLEYLRTPGEAPSASGPSSWCDVRLREAADVFLLLPALSGNTAASPIPVAKVDGSRSSLTVILPARSLAPGPLLPAGPWALTAFSPSENAHVAVSYASVEVLGQDGDGAGGKEGASSGKEEGGSVEGVEVRITAAEGQMFPTDAQRCVPLFYGCCWWLLQDATSITAVSDSFCEPVYLHLTFYQPRRVPRCSLHPPLCSPPSTHDAHNQQLPLHRTHPQL